MQYYHGLSQRQWRRRRGLLLCNSLQHSIAYINRHLTVGKHTSYNSDKAMNSYFSVLLPTTLVQLDENCFYIYRSIFILCVWSAILSRNCLQLPLFYCHILWIPSIKDHHHGFSPLLPNEKIISYRAFLTKVLAKVLPQCFISVSSFTLLLFIHI